MTMQRTSTLRFHRTIIRLTLSKQPFSVMTALPAPHCFSFSLFYTIFPHALSHALARASPYCSPSHVIVLSAHCFPMYLTSFDRHLETLVSTSCLQVSPHVLRSVDTSLNTFLSPALPVEPSSSLAAQRPARRSCLSRLSSPLRLTPSRNISSFRTHLTNSFLIFHFTMIGTLRHLCPYSALCQ